MGINTIAPMTEAHLSDVLAIEQHVNPNPWAKTQIQQSLGQHHAVVLLVDGVVGGFLIYSLVFDEAEILNIAINPSYQRRGLASKLMGWFFANLSKPTASVFLEVRSSNLAAISLYQKLGFKQVGCRKNYYSSLSGQKEDALLMCFSITHQND